VACLRKSALNAVLPVLESQAGARCRVGRAGFVDCDNAGHGCDDRRHYTLGSHLRGHGAHCRSVSAHGLVAMAETWPHLPVEHAIKLEPEPDTDAGIESQPCTAAAHHVYSRGLHAPAGDQSRYSQLGPADGVAGTFPLRSEWASDSGRARATVKGAGRVYSIDCAFFL
jgi:hypothetical protein